MLLKLGNEVTIIDVPLAKQLREFTISIGCDVHACMYLILAMWSDFMVGCW